jgi:hypothetical protein
VSISLQQNTLTVLIISCQSNNFGTHLLFTGKAIHTDSGDHRQLRRVTPASCKKEKKDAQKQQLFHVFALPLPTFPARNRRNFRMFQNGVRRTLSSALPFSSSGSEDKNGTPKDRCSASRMINPTAPKSTP